MMEKSTQITTGELWARLFKASSMENYFDDIGADCCLPTLSEYMNELCERRQEKPGKIISRSNIDSSYGHRLFSGMRNPSRDTVLQLAFGFELTPDDAQQLLKVARKTPLHPKVKRDAVIAYCLHHRKNIVETQQFLYEQGLPLMGGNKNES